MMAAAETVVAARLIAAAVLSAAVSHASLGHFARVGLHSDKQEQQDTGNAEDRE